MVLSTVCHYIILDPQVLFTLWLKVCTKGIDLDEVIDQHMQPECRHGEVLPFQAGS